MGGDARVLVMDALNYLGFFLAPTFGRSNERPWATLRAARRKVRGFVEAARASDLELKVVVDAGLSAEGVAKWKSRRASEVSSVPSRVRATAIVPSICKFKNNHARIVADYSLRCRTKRALHLLSTLCLHVLKEALERG